MNELDQEKDSPLLNSKNGTLLEKATPTVLIVDDEEQSLSRAKAVFTGTEYRVIICNNAIQAMAILEHEPIDCIVTDILMPVIDGYEMIRTIRAGTSANTAITPKSIPILVLSRKRLREDVAAALEAGADDYILKPIDDQVFLDKVEANIRKGNAKRHIFEHALHGNSIAAEIKIQAKIVAVSEADIIIGLSSEISSQTSIDLKSPLFDEIGIGVPLLRLIYCRKVPSGGAISGQFHFEARYAFMGLPETDSRKIRTWLHRQAIARRK